MRVAVLDASAVAPQYIDGPLTKAAVDLGETLASDGVEPHAPDLILYELANVLATAQRRRLFSGEGAMARMEAVGELDLRLHPPDPLPALALAAAHGLSAYDASYLALGLTLGGTLFTADRRLAEGARRAGVVVRELGSG